MIVNGITAKDLVAAVDVASTALGNELEVYDYHQHSKTLHSMRLKVRGIDGPGARRHSHMYLLGAAKEPRRSRFACAHAYGHLFVAIYERAPDARIRTAMATYKHAYDFLAAYPSVLETNVGSLTLPIRFGDECTCKTDNFGADTLEYLGYEAYIPKGGKADGQASVMG